MKAVLFCGLASLAFTPLAIAQADPPQAVTAPVPSVTPAPPSVRGSAWILMDAGSGQVLAEHEADQPLEPASLTKIMTSYVVSAELAAGRVAGDDPVRISEHAWRGGGGGTDGSTSFLPVNSKVSLADLLHGMIVQSGNDASIALAEHVAGSEEVFAQMMNAQAERLGLTDTHFVNSHGLSAPGHHTTARDMARLSRALIRDFPEDYRYYAIKEFTFNGIRQFNRNSLLWRGDGVDGIKTGHHSGAGYCLAASALRGEQRLISVVLGSPGEKQRADDSQALLNWGFRFFETRKLFDAGEEVTRAQVWKGEQDALALGLTSPLQVVFPRGRYDQAKAEMDLPVQLVAPIQAGEEVGVLRILLDGEVLAEQPLHALTAVPEGGFFKRISDGVRLWWNSD